MPLLPREKRSLRIFIALLVFHLVLISFQVPLGSSPSFVEKAVFAVFTPVEHGVVAVFRFLGRLWRDYVFHLQVERQNQDLRRVTFFLRQENSQLRRSLEKFRTQEDVRVLLSRGQGRVRMASVVSLDPVNYKNSLVIDLGSLAGVRKDMVVLDRFGHLVGRVVEPVTLTEAQVQLITDEASGVGVFIRGEKGVGVLSGDGLGGCRLKYILGTSEGIVVGDEVLTSGYDGIFARGLLVGRVMTISREEALFKNIVVQPYFSFRRLGQLAVVFPGGDDARPDGGRQP